MKQQSLPELIEQFEGYLPDKQIKLHLEFLKPHLCAQNAEYFYLLARLYERLAHHNHLADPPRTTARLLFHESLNLYQKAAKRAPAELQSFFLGKQSLLSFFLFTFSPSADPGYWDVSNLRSAFASFSAASKQAKSSELKATFTWLCMFVLILLRRAEAANKLRRDLDAALKLLPTKVDEWGLFLKEQLRNCHEFHQGLVKEIRVKDDLKLTKPQADYLGAMCWMMTARLHEEVHRHLMLIMRRSALRPASAESIVDLMMQNEGMMLAGSGSFGGILGKYGFEVLRLQLAAQMKRHKAEIHFSQCKMQFSAARQHDGEIESGLRRRSRKHLFELPGIVLDLANETGQCSELREAFKSHAVEVSKQAGLAIFANHGVLFDRSRRYRLQQSENGLSVSVATHEPLPFDLRGPKQLFDFYRCAESTAGAYYNTIRDILDYLRTSSTLYGELQTLMRSVRDELASAPDMSSLAVTLDRLEAQASSRTLPLLYLLRDKATFTWSLLEMFEMRKDSIRLDTLYSGECRLLMEDPNEPGTTLEIGADPIFRLAIPLLFRGSRGNEDIRSFLRLVLRSAINTAREQQRCLKKEMQYLDPTLSRSEYRELRELYLCHEKLAEGLLAFVDPFLFRVEDLTEEVLEEGERSVPLLLEAQRAFGAAVRYPSPVIGTVTAIEFFMAYVEGVLNGRRGMLFRRQGARNANRWDAFYERAEERLRAAKRKLEEVESSYLLVSGDQKQEFLRYLTARIATVRGWRERYHFEDTEDPGHAREAIALFDNAARVLDEIGDVQSATQASARAQETSIMLNFGIDESEEFYLRLRAVASLYAVCGDEAGFERVRREMLRHFPGRDLMPFTFPSEESPSLDIQLVEKAEVAAAFVNVWEQLVNWSGDDGWGSLIPVGLDITLRSLLNLAWSQLKNPRLPFGAKEEECVNLVRELFRLLGLMGEVEVVSAEGRIDLVVNSIPIEVKRVVGSLSKRKLEEYRMQLARYVLSEGQRLGVLLTFHFIKSVGDSSSLSFSNLVSCCEIFTHSEEPAGASGCFMVQIVIPQFAAVPSREKASVKGSRSRLKIKER